MYMGKSYRIAVRLRNILTIKTICAIILVDHSRKSHRFSKVFALCVQCTKVVHYIWQKQPKIGKRLKKTG